MGRPFVLYVEDSADDVLLLRLRLEAEGIDADVVHVDTPTAFDAALQHVKPDLIMADGTVPGFDTNVALHAARARCPEVPFYYITGFITDERADALRAAGATGCLAKADKRAVIAVIRAAIGAHAASVEPRLPAPP